MEMISTDQLVAKWISSAEAFDRYGNATLAAALRQCTSELVQHPTSEAHSLVPPQEAA